MATKLTKQFLKNNGYSIHHDSVGNIIMKNEEKVILYEYLEPSWLVQLDDYEIPLIHGSSIVSTLEELQEALKGRK